MQISRSDFSGWRCPECGHIWSQGDVGKADFVVFKNPDPLEADWTWFRTDHGEQSVWCASGHSAVRCVPVRCARVDAPAIVPPAAKPPRLQRLANAAGATLFFSLWVGAIALSQVRYVWGRVRALFKR